MKTLINLVLIGAISIQINAQKIIEKHINPASNQAFIEFKFADDINIKTWDKKEIYLKAEVNIKDGEFNDYYQLNISNISNKLTIESDYGDLFKMWQKKKKELNKKNDYDPCNNLNIDANYTLYLPENYQLKIKSISGNVQTENYQGELEIDIISGNINIKNYRGNLDLETVSGDIDINIAKSKLKAETVTGMIYSDKDLNFDQGKNKMVGSKVTGTFGDIQSQLALKTVSGDIFIRKNF